MDKFVAKLYFYYSAMNAGKSTLLLQSVHNYHERQLDTLILVPNVNTREQGDEVCSRIGLKAPAIRFDKQEDLYALIIKHLRNNLNISCVFVDEAQFLSKQQVWNLTKIVDKHNLPILTYGIRTDFQGEPFPGSLYLLALADHLIEVKTICHCGRKAIMNMRIDEHGNKVEQGKQVLIGGNERYLATCRQHFKQGKSGSQQRVRAQGVADELVN